MKVISQKREAKTQEAEAPREGDLPGEQRGCVWSSAQAQACVAGALVRPGGGLRCFGGRSLDLLCSVRGPPAAGSRRALDVCMARLKNTHSLCKIHIKF